MKLNTFARINFKPVRNELRCIAIRFGVVAVAVAVAVAVVVAVEVVVVVGVVGAVVGAMNLDELKAAALAATPGPWEWKTKVGPYQHPKMQGCVSTACGLLTYSAKANGSTDVASAPEGMLKNKWTTNAHFIALANPAVILKLIAVVEAAQWPSSVSPVTAIGERPQWVIDALKEAENEPP